MQLASRKAVPCITVLGKTDLLGEMKLRDCTTPSAVRSRLEKQLHGGPSDTPSELDVVGMSLMPGQSNLSNLQDTIMRRAFPDDLDDDDSVGLSDSVYLSIFCYNESTNMMLSFRSAIPTAKLQVELNDCLCHVS